MKRFKNKKDPVEKKEEMVELPPRATIHKSERNKLTRIFYTTLTLVFIILTISLLLWGFLFPDE